MLSAICLQTTALPPPSVEFSMALTTDPGQHFTTLTMYYVKHRVGFTDAKPAVKGIINWCRCVFPLRSPVLYREGL